MMNDEKNIVTLLRTLQAFGIDQLMDETPQNHYRLNPKINMPVVKPVSANPPQNFSISKPTTLHLKAPTQDMSSLHTLEDLRQALLQSDGCGLKKTATHMVFGAGNVNAQIMFIGEAPGLEEDQQGLPFVGQSGLLLDNIFNTVEIKRENVYIANIVPWRPPGNRPPTQAEINYSLPFIYKHIEMIAPKLIVLLGGTPTKALLQRSDGILKLRGHFFHYQKNCVATALTQDNNTYKEKVEKALPYLGHHSILALPTLHPAYIMRSPSQKRLVWLDMLLLKKIVGAIQEV